jgi:competence protein ComGF
MTTKPDWGAFVQSLRKEIAEIRRLHLEPLESGKLQIHQSGVDITKSEIASLRQNIASIEAVIAQHAGAE